MAWLERERFSGVEKREKSDKAKERKNVKDEIE